MAGTATVTVAEAASAPTILHSRGGVVARLAPTASLLEDDAIEALRSALHNCYTAGETHVVIDLASVQLLNSKVLEVLRDAEAALLRVSGQLGLANADGTVGDILRVVRLDHLLTSSERRAGAMPEVPDKKAKLGDILLAHGVVGEEQIEQAVTLQQKSGRRLGQIFIDKRWVTEAEMLRALGVQLSLPFVQLRPGLYDADVVELLGSAVIQRLKILPLFKVHDTLYLATSEPQAMPSFREVEDSTQCRVAPVLAAREEIVSVVDSAALHQNYVPDLLAEVDEDFEVVDHDVQGDHEAIDQLAAGSPVINLVNSLIQRAVQEGASDIHIEPGRNQSRVRFRIDGLLYEVMSPRIELHPALVSRLKIMANLDIAERRLPQDGRVQVQTQGRAVDLRFSSLPGLYGEKVVLRVLDKNQAILDVNKLGMNDANLATYRQLLDNSNGLILVTGPTGSGKTTSLYAGLNYLNSIEKNIVTIEDPVEYQLDIVNQNEVHANIGLTFAKVLKHVLRQDPDIVMVGEIREKETAEIAVQAALTGHLVLSTLHTNDSVGAVTRMLDMGVEPYLLSSAMIGVIAQRLVRTVCSNCRTTYLASPELVERFDWQGAGQVTLVRGRGCGECYDSGYRGRVAIHEVVPVEAELQKLVLSNPSRNDLTAYLQSKDIVTLRRDGIHRARQALTTIEEISRVVGS
ncbi:MAG: ATPase, T2SS/T4P/T4SS family [Gammaproteobacteria bacterium]|nr:ATPase, T2SS/T4P/T4SS family [Gammaproteobacteria bacterium]